jgi:hypothetical protein
MLIIACSRMPTLITRSGYRARTSAKDHDEMSAVNRATLESVASASIMVSMKTLRMNVLVIWAVIPCLPSRRGSPPPRPAAVRRVPG